MQVFVQRQNRESDPRARLGAVGKDEDGCADLPRRIREARAVNLRCALPFLYVVLPNEPRAICSPLRSP